MSTPTDRCCTAWGYSFEWTKDHLSAEKIRSLKFSFDELGSQVLERLQSLQKLAPHADEKGDLYTLLEEYHESDKLLERFWGEVNEVPGWVDWEQIARGQDFFHRYAYPYILGFAFQGVLGENLAVGSVGEVLVRTGGFSSKAIIPRLFESFQWVLECTSSLTSIQPGGAAHISTIRIRLLHARVRQAILRLAREDPSYFDTSASIPANDMDSIHTIATFCANPMWLWLPRQGVFPTRREVEDYTALFRYIAYLIGTPHEYFEAPGRARVVMESMLMGDVKFDDTCRLLGRNFVAAFVDWPPLHLSREFLEAACWWINGQTVCENLGMRRPSAYHTCLMIGSCFLAMTTVYVSRCIGWVDRRLLATSRKYLEYCIVQSKLVLKERSTFDFKYKPAMGKRMRDVAVKPSQLHIPFRARIVEWYLAIAFIMGAIFTKFLPLGLYCAWSWARTAML